MNTIEVRDAMIPHDSTFDINAVPVDIPPGYIENDNVNTPVNVDYLNNDYAPDLIKFLQSKIGSKKNISYYGFLKAIGEENLPSFDDRQENFIKYASDFLPIVRTYEYLIMQFLMMNAGIADIEDVKH